MEVGLQALFIHFTRLEQLVGKTAMDTFVELCFRWTCTQGSLAFHALEVQQIGQIILLSMGENKYLKFYKLVINTILCCNNINVLEMCANGLYVIKWRGSCSVDRKSVV